MLKKSIKGILLIEDNQGDARLLRQMLKDGKLDAELKHAVSMDEAEQYLAVSMVDIVLLDLGLPDAQGLEAVRRARLAAPRIPLVVLTGLDDESLATQELQEGAQDYLIKGQIISSYGAVETREISRAMRYAIERKTMEDALTHSAEHDFLTGLPNRMLLNDRISQAVEFASRHSNQLAVLFLDLDAFKYINDSLGHSVGDKLLQSVATRLVDCVRSSDTVSRQGGDEFLLSEVQESQDAVISAQRILEAIAIVHSIDEHDLHITTSIGVSVYPDDGLSAETLIKNADTAMYQAKEDGRQNYRFFKPAMNVRAVERQTIEEGLRRALERQEFVLHYQPKIDLRTGRISGAEALLRWTHPIRGEVSPAQFIPVAEASGLILPIGAWVLRQACEQARAWIDVGLPLATIAVNVSGVEFQHEKFLEGLFTILHDTGLDPRFLELELTESVLMKRADSSASILRSVRENGIKVAIEDFGTGYSSLSYLRKFPVDALKIDQSFVRQIGIASDDRAIVTAVIAMARSLKLRVVAEGVETLEQLEFLQAYDCDEAQGYYFSRPLSAPLFAKFLESGISEIGDGASESVVPEIDASERINRGHTRNTKILNR
jgi:diguanylate cyclase (GGDEF)-like protein